MKSATITLENTNLRIVLDKTTGALVRIRCVQTGWSVLDREELGVSFQLLVPARTAEDWHAQGRRNVIAEGTRQPAPLVQKRRMTEGSHSGGTRLSFRTARRQTSRWSAACIQARRK